jgi:Tfp pilus assembly protein PilO
LGQSKDTARYRLRRTRSFKIRDPQTVVRGVLGVLLLANLVAAGLVLFPPGGSAEELERERVTLESQLRSQLARLDVTRAHAAAVQKGREQGDDFLNKYFLKNRKAFSTLLTELENAAQQTKLKPREGAFSAEPVEGSDNLSMISITAAYEGTYQDLMHFVYAIDRSPGLLIIESMSTAPQTNSDVLAVSMRLNTFVRDVGDDGGE